MATITASTTLATTPTAAMATVKKPGPPVPPRPQHTTATAGLLKTQRESTMHVAGNRVAATTPTKITATSSVYGGGHVHLTRDTVAVVAHGAPEPQHAHATHPVVEKKPPVGTVDRQQQSNNGGRTIIYKSPSLNLQKKLEEREKRSMSVDATAAGVRTGAGMVAMATRTLSNGVGGAPKPPLKLRKAPDVPGVKPRQMNGIKLGESHADRISHSAVTATAATHQVERSNSSPNNNNVVIVHSANGGVNLNRHNSMGTPKLPTAGGLKETRFSLGKADFDKIGRIQLDQLPPAAQPLPKPRKIVQMPVATLDLEDIDTSSHSPASSSSVSIFRRSKTTLDSFTSRSNVTTINTGNSSTTSSSTNGFLSGKTVEIKNNLKNAAERLFSEIVISQQKQPPEPPTIITKHERAVQHQALLQQELALERQKRAQQTKLSAATQTQKVTMVATKQTPTNETLNNCTRININSSNTSTNANSNSSSNSNALSPTKSLQMDGRMVNSPEKKTAFHEILISELAAMRGKSSSMDHLHTKDITCNGNGLGHGNDIDTPKKVLVTSPAMTTPTSPNTPNGNVRKRCNSLEDNDPDMEDVDEDNVEDTEGDDEDLSKTLQVGKGSSTPRKRCPSGCSSDSSPYGTERSARIRTSDWIEVGDNGKTVTLTSCHISLEDSGMEDEERLDEMSSSGVGDSWDSVKEAENKKRCRTVKRVMPITELPPLPKSLSGFNKMLGSDSGLLSDTDPSLENNNNTTNSSSNNNNNSSSNSNSNNNSECQKDDTTSTTSSNNNLNNNSFENNNELESDNTAAKDEQINENELTGLSPTNTRPGSTLDTQLAILKREMNGLRELDLSLLSQLWALNASIQEFRTILEQQAEYDETYSPHSPTPSSYESASDGDDYEPINIKESQTNSNKIITTQPKLSKSSSAGNAAASKDAATHSSKSAAHTPHEIETCAPTTPTEQHQQQQQQQQQKPPLPKPLELKPVPRMRSAPPPPPTTRKGAAPPRPT